MVEKVFLRNHVPFWLCQLIHGPGFFAVALCQVLQRSTSEGEWSEGASLFLDLILHCPEAKFSARDFAVVLQALTKFLPLQAVLNFIRALPPNRVAPPAPDEFAPSWIDTKPAPELFRALASWPQFAPPPEVLKRQREGGVAFFDIVGPEWRSSAMKALFRPENFPTPRDAEREFGQMRRG
jgi:hypothetical protein